MLKLPAQKLLDFPKLSDPSKCVLQGDLKKNKRNQWSLSEMRRAQLGPVIWSGFWIFYALHVR